MGRDPAVDESHPRCLPVVATAGSPFTADVLDGLRRDTTVERLTHELDDLVEVDVRVWLDYLQGPTIATSSLGIFHVLSM